MRRTLACCALAAAASGQLTYAPPVVYNAGQSVPASFHTGGYQYPPAFSTPAYTEALGAFYGAAAPAAGFGMPVPGAEPLDPQAVDEQTARYQKELEADLELHLQKLEQDAADHRAKLLARAEQAKADGHRRIVEDVKRRKEGLALEEQQRLEVLRAAARDQTARVEAQSRDVTRQWHEQKAQEAFRQTQGALQDKQRAAQEGLNSEYTVLVASNDAHTLSAAQKKYAEEVERLQKEYQAALGKLQGDMAAAVDAAKEQPAGGTEESFRVGGGARAKEEEHPPASTWRWR